jgi:hypothetical protein
MLNVPLTQMPFHTLFMALRREDGEPFRREIHTGQRLLEVAFSIGGCLDPHFRQGFAILNWVALFYTLPPRKQGNPTSPYVVRPDVGDAFVQQWFNNTTRDSRVNGIL